MGTDTKSNFFLELADYYQSQADKLQVARNSANIYGNPSDRGTIREDAFFDFLKTHVPLRCLVTKGGFVFDSLGNKSKQIDIIITNDQTFQFRESSEDKTRQFNCVEGCYAVISVKSHLGKKELFESLDNLASVSTHKKIIMGPRITNKEDLLRQIPQRIVFAYKGNTAETTNEHLKEYYKTHKIGEQSPDMIIVNNQFYIFRAGVLGVQLQDGTFIKPGEYTIHKGSRYSGAAPLFQLIGRMQTVSVLSPHMQIDFNAYGKAIDKAIYEKINEK